MKKLRFFESGIEGGLKLTRNLNEKVSVVKNKNIRNSAKILLCKQKMKNLIKIYNIIKVKIMKIYTLYIETKTFKRQNKFQALFVRLREISNELELTTKMIGKGKFEILEIIREKCNKKMFKLTNTCQSLFSNLFITKKPETYDQIFLFYLNQGHYIEVNN